MSWNIKISTNLDGNQINLNLTSSEESLLGLLRAMYPQVEAMIKNIDRPSAQLPSGFIDDALALLRCLVFNRIEAYRGENVSIAKVGSK